MGEFEKRLKEQWDSFPKDAIEFFVEGDMKLINEAKNEFPQHFIEVSKDFKEGCFTKIEHDDFFELIDWFKKWFGDSQP